MYKIRLISLSKKRKWNKLLIKVASLSLKMSISGPSRTDSRLPKTSASLKASRTNDQSTLNTFNSSRPRPKVRMLP
jgi:hypothetical protein